MRNLFKILILTILCSSYLFSNQIDNKIISYFHNYENKSEVLYETHSDATKVVANEQDSLILVNFYHATDGDNWSDKSNWLTGAPLGQWAGVGLNKSGRVETLYFVLSNLSGTIPKELGNLAELVYLNLSTNQLTGSIPAELGNLSKLEELYLYENQLTGTIHKEFAGLESLKKLYLYFNQLSGNIPTELGNLTKLEELILVENQLTGIIPSELGNLVKLEELNLAENQLTGTIPSELGSISSLKNLYLQGNQLTGEIPKELGKLDSLHELILNLNQLSGTIPDELGDMTALNILYIRNNQLEGKIPESILSLDNLQFFSIRHNKFDSGLENIPLHQLQSVWLYDNKFDFADFNKANINATTYEYAPQDSLGEQEIIILEEGKEYILSSATEHVDGNMYIWFKDGVEIQNETGKELIISNSQKGVEGIYTCSVTNEVAPKLTLYRRPLTLTFDKTASVNDYIKITNEFKVYPNPARDFVAIEFNNPAIKSSIQILDLLGSEVLSLDVSNETLINIDISQFTNGYYNIIISTDDKKYFQPLFVNR